MYDIANWQYDEFQHIGVDYDSVEAVEAYDQRMQTLRDFTQENEEIFNALDLSPESVVVEIGSGTCEFSIAAAALCTKVYAVDISQVMLDYARRKASARGVSNIAFSHAGFLTYQHDGDKVDAVVSQLALHHLPDFWKGVALQKIYELLKDGGCLFLRDLVYSFDIQDYKDGMNRLIAGMEASAGEKMASDVQMHIKNEHSTTGWIMEGLMRSVGFEILKVDYSRGAIASYVCIKHI